MRLLRVSVTMLFVALICSTLFFSGCKKIDEKTRKIGAILPLTGGSSYLGESVLVGMKIAFEDFNKKNNSNYELIPYDTQSKLSNVNNIYQLIRSTNNPNIVLSWMSSVASNLVGITEKDRVLLLVGAAKEDLTDRKKYVLRFWPNALDLAEMESEFVIKTLKSQRVGIFYINDDYGLSLANQMTKKFEKSNIQVVFRETISTDITDYKNIILKHKNEEIDLIYVAAYDKVYSYLIKPLKQYFPDVKILTDLTFCNFKTLSDFGFLSEGIYTVGTEVDNRSSKNDEVVKLRERVKKDFGKDPDFNTALGYDMAWVALESINNTDGTPSKMKDYVTQQKNFNGKCGKIIFDISGDAKFNLYLLQIQNRKAFEVKQY